MTYTFGALSAPPLSTVPTFVLRVRVCVCVCVCVAKTVDLLETAVLPM
jgi:hypothetical protein